MGALHSRILQPLSAVESSPQRDRNLTGSRISTTILCDENFLGVLIFLARTDLDAAQIANRRLLKLVHELRFVCLRPLKKVSLWRFPNRMFSKLEKWFVARIQIKRKPLTTQEEDSCRSWQIAMLAAQGDEYMVKSDDNDVCFESELAVDVVGWLLTRLQSACVSEFKIDGLDFLWPVVEVFQEQACTIFVKKQLNLTNINACSKAWFAVLDCFGGYNGLTTAAHFVSHTNDELVRTALRKEAHVLSISPLKPKHALAYRISEDAILEFCFDERQRDRQVELTLYYPTVSPQFFARLVEASIACRSDAVMHLLVYVEQPHNQDTTAYTDNLMQLHNCELFDFPGDVHSQVMLYNVPHPHCACIELRRGRIEATGAHFMHEF